MNIEVQLENKIQFEIELIVANGSKLVFFDVSYLYFLVFFAILMSAVSLGTVVMYARIARSDQINFARTRPE